MFPSANKNQIGRTCIFSLLYVIRWNKVFTLPMIGMEGGKSCYWTHYLHLAQKYLLYAWGYIFQGISLGFSSTDRVHSHRFWQQGYLSSSKNIRISRVFPMYLLWILTNSLRSLAFKYAVLKKILVISCTITHHTLT